MATSQPMCMAFARLSRVAAAAQQQRGGAALAAVAFSRANRCANEVVPTANIAKSTVACFAVSAPVGRVVHENAQIAFVSPGNSQMPIGNSIHSQMILGTGALASIAGLSMFANRTVMCSDETDATQYVG
eukprot:TRINITY_DN7247_c0_g1_i6.p2 TRINITY_DN7247_c0_g1~~TRINITY_DN7247_c0_g1_i6.p2  ORF type:complete len:130 (+),score=21.31 TRINITY_DN7247_c0_g1_i6:138-527(+)